MNDFALEWTWLVKITLLLAAVWMVWLVAQKSNPRWQVWPFRAGLLGVVLLSLVSFAPPLLEWPVNVVATADQPADEIVLGQPPISQPPRGREQQIVAPLATVSELVNRPPDRRRAQPQTSSPPAMPEQAASPTVEGWNWLALAAKFWIFIVVVGILRMVGGFWSLRQLVARSTEPSDSVSTVAGKLASALRLAAPTVGVTDEISSPSVVGLLRPVILLPTSIASSESPQALASALSHELAHIAGNDLRWDAVLRLFRLLAWPHPLVWGMHRAHRAACERVSDLVAADLINDRTAYADCLANIALNLQRSSSNYGLAMARQADVVTRLKTLASGLQAKALGRRGKVAALATLLIAITIGTTTVVQVQQSKAQEPESVQNSKTFVLTVLSEDDDQPLVDAEVKFTFRSKESTKKTVLTDQAGVAKFTFPSEGKDAYLRIRSRHSGNVPYYASYDRQPIDLLPTSKTIRMESGELVGGIIVDADGAPVSNADVSISVPTIDPPRDSHVYGLLDMKTGPDGRWSLDAAPQPVSQLKVRVKHDEFENNSFSVRPGLDEKYALESGWIIEGNVRSADRTPVADAQVISGHDRFGSSKPKTTTNADGDFKMGGLASESTLLTVTVDGYAPAMKEVDFIAGKPAAVDFVLQPGRTIRFQFEDPSGKPIEGAGIAADTWRGHRSVKWRSKTNADGFVEWTGAPEDAVIYDSFCSGFRSERNMALLARDEPHTIVLDPEYTVTGNVTDAETGKPVSELAAEFGWADQNRAIRWSSMNKIKGRNGKFSLTYDEAKSKLFVRVTADGYQPWISKEFDLSQPAPELSIELEPGSGPSAVVLTPAGKPAENASVILGLEGNSFQFQRGYKAYGAPQKTKADADGRFQLQVVEAGKAGVVAVIHDSGYAEVSLAEVSAGNPIQLQAWAKLEVRVVEGGQPVAGRQVQFRPTSDRSQRVNVFSYSIEKETDDSGVAVLERVIPCAGYVSMVLEQDHQGGSTHYSNGGFALELTPEQSKSIQFGGSGCSVVGKISLPDNPSVKHSWKQNEAGEVTTAGKTKAKLGRRSWRFLVADDGSFRVAELPNGEYELSVDLTEERNPNQCGHGRKAGSVAKRAFEVNDESMADIDLGVLQGKWDKVKGVGELASNFVAKTRTGSITLDQFSGKFVLLDFWATWCSPCIAEMPELGELHKRFKDDEQFELIAVSLDSDFSDALQMADDRKWQWRIASGGSGYHGLLPRAYDVKAIPVKILIGPSGKIIYRGTSLKEIAALLESRLAEAQPDDVQQPIADLRIKPVPVDDQDFTPAGKTAELALGLSRPYSREDSKDKSKVKPGLFLYDSAGELIRHVPAIVPSGWLKHADRLAVDEKRQRIYAVDGYTLHCLAANGSRIYTCPIAGLNAVSVAPDSGDIWCLCLAGLGNGWTVVLDKDGHEKVRYPVFGFTLRYSQSDRGFWYVGKTAKLVSLTGEVLVEHSLPSGAYTLAAMGIAPNGGCWALESSHPDVPGSHEQLWRITRQGMTKTGEFGSMDLNTDAGTSVNSLAVVDDQCWVGVTNWDGESKKRSPLKIHRYREDGELAGTLESTAGPRLMEAADDNSVWVVTAEQIKKIGKDGKPVAAFPRPAELPDGVHQSSWLMPLSKSK